MKEEMQMLTALFSAASCEVGIGLWVLSPIPLKVMSLDVGDVYKDS